MRKVISILVAAVLVLGLGLSCAFAEKTEMVGGWQAAEDPTITEERQAVLDKALENLMGVNYVPVAYLGSQVVAGINHAFLCQGTVVYPDAVPEWKILFLYEDLEGNVTVMNIADFDFGALCTYGAEQ